MSYNDIRYINLGEGRIPVGNRFMASWMGYSKSIYDTENPDSEKMEISFLVRPCEQSQSVGPLCINVFEEHESGHATIMFPIADCAPYCNTFTCTATKHYMYPESVSCLVLENGGCVVTLLFNVSKKLHTSVVADIDGVEIVAKPQDGTLQGTLHTLTSCPVVSVLSKEDYGNSLPSVGTEGQLFFVLSE